MSRMDLVGKVGLVMLIVGVIITVAGFVVMGVGGIAMLLTLFGEG